MRFLADENVPRVVIERLRVDGHDVISVAETKPSAPDDEILNVAEADGRILITRNRDQKNVFNCSTAASIFGASCSNCFT
jgi:predicted nuclease of predicted toxin-antitoxin system